MTIDVGISRVHFPITALGPGRRIGIWFQGCSIRCSGCMSRDTWELAASRMPVAALLAQIGPWLPQADGVTISGGEPFDQPLALEVLVRGLRASFAKSILETPPQVGVGQINFTVHLPAGIKASFDDRTALAAFAGFLQMDTVTHV